MSSEIFLQPGRPVSISSIAFWKISDAAFIPNTRRLYLLSPTWMLNVVMWRLSGSSSSWWYPEERPSLLRTVAPFRSATRSSIVGIRCFSRVAALLASRMSTHNLTCPEVGPVTFSIMSRLSSRSNSFSTSFLTWKGIRQCGCCYGCTSGSMWSLTIFPLTLPMPPNRSLNSPLARYWGPVLSIPTWLIIFRSPSLCAVAYPRRFPELP